MMISRVHAAVWPHILGADNGYQHAHDTVLHALWFSQLVFHHCRTLSLRLLCLQHGMVHGQHDLSEVGAQCVS